MLVPSHANPHFIALCRDCTSVVASSYDAIDVEKALKREKCVYTKKDAGLGNLHDLFIKLIGT